VRLRKRFRISISALLGLILVIAVDFAALRAGSLLWAALMSTLTGVLLSTSVVCAAVGRGRPFWTGFAAFGWTYVVLSLLSVSNDDEPFLHPISTIVQAAAGYLHPDHRPKSATENPVDMEDVGYLTYYGPAFKMIGLCSVCLAFAFAGAYLSVTLARRGPTAEGP